MINEEVQLPPTGNIFMMKSVGVDGEAIFIFQEK